MCNEDGDNGHSAQASTSIPSSYEHGISHTLATRAVVVSAVRAEFGASSRVDEDTRSPISSQPV